MLLQMPPTLFFYKEWQNINIENELINFILPLEDLDDISKITEMKDRIEELNIDNLVNKYDIKNYIFTLMDYQDEKLNVHLKINFNNNKISKNILFDLKNIDDELALSSIIKDLKLKITDLWKEENLINLLMPLIHFFEFIIETISYFQNLLYELEKTFEEEFYEFNRSKKDKEA